MIRVTRKPSSATNIGTRTAREKLPIQKEPHWTPAGARGTALGYYKGGSARTWIVRQFQPNKTYKKFPLGQVDDFVEADGNVVLNYRQALNKAINLQLETRTPAPRHYADGATLNSIMEAYLDEHLKGKGSHRFTELTWKQHIEPDIGRELVSALNDAALKKWHKGMAAKPPTVRAAKGGRKDAEFDPTDADQVRARKASANRTLTMVKAALNWGRAAKMIPTDQPTWWRDVKPFSLGEEPEPRMLDESEIKRLLNAAPADLKTLLQGALATGARRGELISLQCRAYDPDTGTLRIYQHKTKKTLTQPLTPEGVALFDSLTAGRKSTDLIFRRADGKEWTPDDVTKPMRAAVEAANLDDVSFKTTRATYGKRLLVATKDIQLVAEALGHSDSRITRKHYARYLTDDLARGIAKLPPLGFNIDSKVKRTGVKRK